LGLTPYFSEILILKNYLEYNPEVKVGSLFDNLVEGSDKISDSDHNPISTVTKGSEND
jgi:hypothetical protein